MRRRRSSSDQGYDYYRIGEGKKGDGLLRNFLSNPFKKSLQLYNKTMTQTMIKEADATRSDMSAVKRHESGLVKADVDCICVDLEVREVLGVDAAGVARFGTPGLRISWSQVEAEVRKINETFNEYGPPHMRPGLTAQWRTQQVCIMLPISLALSGPFDNGKYITDRWRQAAETATEDLSATMQ